MTVYSNGMRYQPVENTLGGLPLGKERKKEDKKLLMLIGEILVSIK